MNCNWCTNIVLLGLQTLVQLVNLYHVDLCTRDLVQIAEKHFVPLVRYTCSLVHCCHCCVDDLVECGICTIMLIWYIHYWCNWCLAGWWSAVHQMERGRCPRHPQLIRLPHSKHRPLPPAPRPRPRPRSAPLLPLLLVIVIVLIQA